MTLKTLRSSAAFVFGATLLAASVLAQSRPAATESPYGGVTVEEIIARVNDQVITHSDYDRAQKEMDDEARGRGASMQAISAAHKDLLRNLIDRQLWLSKGKELGITGETELVNRLNEIRKQNHMETLEDLEKAARAQGVSYEDFKANIRNQIIMQQVMREAVGRRAQFTPGELQRYYNDHKQEYERPESVRLSEILIAVEAASANDPAKLAEAKAKADDLMAKLKSGGDFAQLARAFSDGPTAAQGGDLGEFQRGNLAKALEDATFTLKAGEVAAPIRTRQGYILLKVVEHVYPGAPELKEVQQQVEEALYMSKMDPAIREYLTKMREEAYIDIKPGYVDSGASPRQTKPVFSAYVPPAPKKKVKVERTRYRETAKSYRKTSTAAKSESAPPKSAKTEKVRYGQPPTQSLPNAPAGKTEDGGAAPLTAEAPSTSLDSAPAQPAGKSRYSARATEPHVSKRQVKQEAKQKQAAVAPPAADSTEVANRQTQSAPLGLGGDTATPKSKKNEVKGEKTRFSDHNKKEEPASPGAPASK